MCYLMNMASQLQFSLMFSLNMKAEDAAQIDPNKKMKSYYPFLREENMKLTFFRPSDQ